MRRNRRHVQQPIALEERAEQLVRQARRWRRRGKHRRCMLALHQACAFRQEDAALWTLYAAECVAANRCEDAERALGHAIWLRQRCRDGRRAQVTRALLECLRSCGVLSRAA